MAVRPFAVGIMLGVHQDPRVSVEKCKKVGVNNAQLGVPPDEWLTLEGAMEVKRMFDEAGVTITTVFCGFGGERYDDIETVRRTVGYVPEETREERVRNFANCRMGLRDGSQENCCPLWLHPRRPNGHSLSSLR
jgi:hypothetical protein